MATKTIKEEVSILLTAAESIEIWPPRLLHLHELPPWKHPDPYILRGYRKHMPSFRHCYESLFYLHNETVNIWSHLLGAVCMAYLLARISLPSLYEADAFRPEDANIVRFYLVCTICCLLLSTVYHTAICHSADVAHRCLKLDYLGIVMCITSTNMSAGWFALIPWRGAATFYLALNLVLAALTYRAVMDPDADGHGKAFWRSVVFISLGLNGLVPLIHSYVASGLAPPDYPFSKFVGSGLLYVIGAAIYVKRVPEKQWPGTFDIWGASHQIFHVLVLTGQALHTWGLHQALFKGGLLTS